MHDGTKNPVGLTRPILIQPEIQRIAGGVVGPPCRGFVKHEPDRTEPVGPRHDPRAASYVMPDHAVMYDVAGEAKSPGTVAIFDFAHINYVVRGRQTDPRDRRHTEERAGPQR